MHRSPTARQNTKNMRPLKVSSISNHSLSGSDLELEVLKEETHDILNESTCPLLRDITNKFAPLERLFGVLNHGCAFGEYAV